MKKVLIVDKLYPVYGLTDDDEMFDGFIIEVSEEFLLRYESVTASFRQLQGELERMYR